jgi:predicted  nucleic acid-binding Zn-ribbon protein
VSTTDHHNAEERERVPGMDVLTHQVSELVGAVRDLARCASEDRGRMQDFEKKSTRLFDRLEATLEAINDKLARFDHGQQSHEIMMGALQERISTLEREQQDRRIRDESAMKFEKERESDLQHFKDRMRNYAGALTVVFSAVQIWLALKK